MKQLLLLLVSLSMLSVKSYCQGETKCQLIYAYDTKRDSINGIENTVYLYFLNEDHNYYKVLEMINGLDFFNYDCRYGFSSDEYFVFSLESEVAEGTKIIYWNKNSHELFTSQVIEEYLTPLVISFSSESLSLTCVSTDKNNCGAFVKKPVELIKKISYNDIVGNRLPPSLTIVQTWLF
jgi:hypothetical protein